MKTLCWNCCGANNSPTIKALKALVRRHRIDLIFLCETKVLKDRIAFVANSLGAFNSFAVEAEHDKGGMALL